MHIFMNIKCVRYLYIIYIYDIFFQELRQNQEVKVENYYEQQAFL